MSWLCPEIIGRLCARVRDCCYPIYQGKGWGFSLKIHYKLCTYDISQVTAATLRWRHNRRDIVSNHQPHDCLLNRLFRCRSTKTSKLRVTGLCAGNSPVPGEFPAQMASNAENVSIWWRHHDLYTEGTQQTNDVITTLFLMSQPRCGVIMALMIT